MSVHRLGKFVNVVGEDSCFSIAVTLDIHVATVSAIVPFCHKEKVHKKSLATLATGLSYMMQCHDVAVSYSTAFHSRIVHCAAVLDAAWHEHRKSIQPPTT